MSEARDGPSMDPGAQVLVSVTKGQNLVSYLPETTAQAVIVAIRSTPTEVETALEGQGIEARNAVVVPVGLDKPSYRGYMELTGVVRPSELPQLGRRISERLEAAEGKDNWLVIDDLIMLLMYSGDHRVVRFLRSIASRVRINDFRAIYGLERAAVSSATFRALNEICEYHLDLRAD